MSLLDKKTLFVDIGSSNIDWRIDECYKSVNIQDFQPSVIPQHQVSIIACVENHDIIKYFFNPIIVKPKPHRDLYFDYDLAQLGVDRFLGIVAGYDRHPEQDFMLVDIGTFVTIDKVRDKRHIDGGIAPGLFRLQACKTFIGKDSQKSWHLGTRHMLRDMIAKRCGAFDGKILITGGGQQIINIEEGEYYQNLVIEGLKVLYG